MRRTYTKILPISRSHFQVASLVSGFKGTSKDYTLTCTFVRGPKKVGIPTNIKKANHSLLNYSVSCVRFTEDRMCVFEKVGNRTLSLQSQRQTTVCWHHQEHISQSPLVIQYEEKYPETSSQENSFFFFVLAEMDSHRISFFGDDLGLPRHISRYFKDPVRTMVNMSQVMISPKFICKIHILGLTTLHWVFRTMRDTVAVYTLNSCLSGLWIPELPFPHLSKFPFLKFENFFLPPF